MTMKERIARAILKRRFYDCEPDMYGHDLERFFAEIDSEHIHEARDEAEAVLEEIGEPTQDMYFAAYETGVPAHFVRPVWEAMIEAAKAEGQPE